MIKIVICLNFSKLFHTYMYQDMLLDVYNNISTHINFALVVEFHEKIIDKYQLLYFMCILRVREFLVFI